MFIRKLAAYLFSALLVLTLFAFSSCNDYDEYIIVSRDTPEITTDVVRGSDMSNGQTEGPATDTKTAENTEPQTETDDDQLLTFDNVTTGTETMSRGASDDDSAVVYITDSGNKYHRANCSYLKKSKHEISLSDAISQGYEPCSRCNG